MPASIALHHCPSAHVCGIPRVEWRAGKGVQSLGLAGCVGRMEAEASIPIAVDPVGPTRAGEEHSWVFSCVLLAVNGAPPPSPRAR